MIKKQTRSTINFSQPPILVCSRCLNPISKSKSLILLPYFFQRISQPPHHDKQNGKHCQLPPYIVQTLPLFPIFKFSQKGNFYLLFSTFMYQSICPSMCAMCA